MRKQNTTCWENIPERFDLEEVGRKMYLGETRLGKRKCLFIQPQLFYKVLCWANTKFQLGAYYLFIF